jgi:SAM-dependent methyltransferase
MAGTKHRFQNHYKQGFMPWVHSKPDFNLVEMVNEWPIKPCKALELGCGTGTDAIWLAKQGFDVTAVDAVDIPIEIARKQAVRDSVKCNFLVREFMKEHVPGGPFAFAFDRGYFHSYKSHVKRKQIAKTLSNLLMNDGLWLTLAGSCDSPPRTDGPPMRSAKNIVDAVEPFFEIKLLRASVFGSESEIPANIWVGLMKKRS